MEVVKAFNSELSALYEGKPPISKAKMTSITKTAIKGIKFYKHIVQSVEKFVQKCRPEYKVPGLYVVDSIVRQSRHQFGQDKDVFAPRFTKNIHATFQHLFKCPPEDRPKIVRVLNLWQKNQVFPPDVIQPLLDMAVLPVDGNAVADQNVSQTSDMSEVAAKANHGSSSWQEWNHSGQMLKEASTAVTESKTYALTQENVSLATMAAEADVGLAGADPALLIKLQSLASQLLGGKEEKTQPSEPPAHAVKFNKKLLDFDYGDEEEEEEEEEPPSQAEEPPPKEDSRPAEPNALALSMAQNLLNNPELLRQLQQMQQTLQQSSEVLRSTEGTPVTAASTSSFSHSSTTTQRGGAPVSSAPTIVVAGHPYNPVLPNAVAAASQPSYPPSATPTTLAASVAGPMAYVPDFSAVAAATAAVGALPEVAALQNIPLFPPTLPPSMPYGAIDPVGFMAPRLGDEGRMPGEAPPYMASSDLDERGVLASKDLDLRGSGGLSPSRDRDRRRRSRSRSPRRRGRSRSPDSDGGRNRSRYRRDRSWDRQTRERERERERERRRKGFPPIKKNCLSVCSATLWLGHVPKSVSETDLHNTFGEYGTIVSIDMIPPRGCAFVCMDRRQDAFRALQKLKNLKLQGSLIKMAWAPGKGVKGKDFKDFWEVDLGVSYIPYEKLPDSVDLLALEEGGVLDEDSLTQELREKKAAQEQEQQASKPQAELTPVIAMPNMAGTVVAPTTVAMVPPPPLPQFGIAMPPGRGPVPSTSKPQIEGMLPSQGLMMSQIPLPMGVPPPNQMLMVPPSASQMMAGSPLGLLPPHMGLPGAPMGTHPGSLAGIGLPPGMPPASGVVAPTSLATTQVLSSASVGDATVAGSGGAVTTVPSTTTETTAVPMACDTDGDATPTEEDGTSVPLNSIPTPADTPAAPDQPWHMRFGGVGQQQSYPSLGFSQQGFPQAGADTMKTSESERRALEAESEQQGKSGQAEKREDTSENMQLDDSSGGEQKEDSRGAQSDGFPPRPQVPPNMCGPAGQGMMGAPMRMGGPAPSFPFGDNGPRMQFPGHRMMGPDQHRMMGPDPRMMGGPPNQRVMGGLNDQRMGGPSDQRMMGGPPDQRMMGGPQDQRMGGPHDQRMMGGPPDHRMLGGPPDRRMMGGPPDHRMMGGPPDHRMMGGPRDRQMGGPGEHRMLGGPPDHRIRGGHHDHRMMGPHDRRMMGGPDQGPAGHHNHRVMGGHMEHGMMGGPPDHRMIGGPPDHRMMGGPQDFRMMGPMNHRMMGPKMRMMGPNPRMPGPGMRMPQPGMRSPDRPDFDGNSHEPCANIEGAMNSSGGRDGKPDDMASNRFDSKGHMGECNNIIGPGGTNPRGGAFGAGNNRFEPGGRRNDGRPPGAEDRRGGDWNGPYDPHYGGAGDDRGGGPFRGAFPEGAAALQERNAEGRWGGRDQQEEGDRRRFGDGNERRRNRGERRSRWSREDEDVDRRVPRDRDRNERSERNDRGDRSDRDRNSRGDYRRDRDRDRDRSRDRTREQDSERSRAGDRSRDRDKERERSRDRDRSRDKDRVRDRGGKDNERSRDRSRDRERSKEREKSKERDKDREEDKEGEGERSREREKSRESERGKDKEQGQESSECSKSERSRDEQHSREPSECSKNVPRPEKDVSASAETNGEVLTTNGSTAVEDSSKGVALLDKAKEAAGSTTDVAVAELV